VKQKPFPSHRYWHNKSIKNAEREGKAFRVDAKQTRIAGLPLKEQ